MRSPGMSVGYSMTSLLISGMGGAGLRLAAQPLTKPRANNETIAAMVLGVEDTVQILFQSIFIQIGSSGADFVGLVDFVVHRIAHRFILTFAGGWARLR